MIMMLVAFHVDPSRLEAFTERLKTLGNWSNRLPDAWLLETNMTPRQVRDALKDRAGAGDRVFVARISRNWAGFGMGETFPAWIGRREFGKFTEQG